MQASIAGTDLEVTHINLLDNTVEGVSCERDSIFSVQYHPESAPGPQDSAYLFDQFYFQDGGDGNMPKRTDMKKILVIGSGPIVIGQAAEFDYAGTQACLALREEGYEVVLANSNPATIMTDTAVADKVYMEPLTLEYLAKILRYERPDAILPGIGGQTGLNLAMELERTRRAPTSARLSFWARAVRASSRAEDRALFKELCEELGEPVLPSIPVHSVEEGIARRARDRLSGRTAPGVHPGRHGRRLRRRRRGSGGDPEKRPEALPRAPGARGKERQRI